MPSEPTEADIQLVAEAMYEDDNGSVPGAWYTPWADVDKHDWKAYTFRARAALAALADAGRLLPDGEVEIREEWGIVWRSERGGIVMTDEAIPGRLQAEVEGRRRVGTYDIASFKVRSRIHRTFEAGWTLTGPWVAVDGTD